MFGSSAWRPTADKPWWDTGALGEVLGAGRSWVNGAPPLAMTCTGPRGSPAAWMGDGSGPQYTVQGYPCWDALGGTIDGGAGLWPSLGRAHSAGFRPGYD